MLQSLERRAGLPIAFNPTANSIEWQAGVSCEQTRIRSLTEMRAYIREADAISPTDAIYTVYRNLRRTADTEAIQATGLRYDLTVIPPGVFLSNSHSRGPIRIAEGRRPEAGYSHAEFFRTAGHYHPVKAGTAIAYPEVYEVISGRAYWLLQKPRAGDPARLEEMYVVEAGPGEKALMTPGFGHISVNPFGEPLVMANWISSAFTYDYKPFERLRGGGYWVLEAAATDAIEFERNANYREVPELKKLRPKEVPELGLIRSQPLYQLSHELGKLRFLSHPEEFVDILTIEKCYRTL